MTLVKQRLRRGELKKPACAGFLVQHWSVAIATSLPVTFSDTRIRAAAACRPSVHPGAGWD
jgi:hypothetical protein